VEKGLREGRWKEYEKRGTREQWWRRRGKGSWKWWGDGRRLMMIWWDLVEGQRWKPRRGKRRRECGDEESEG
jgi:hypothetical protein